MIIVAGGDSFVWGTELKDTVGDDSKSIMRDPKNGFKKVDRFPIDIPIKRSSRSTFFALLAAEYGMHYECVARAGNANQAIARQVLDYCESHKDIDKFVLVSWTFTNRYEFRFPFKTQTFSDHWESINTWTVADLDELEAASVDNREMKIRLVQARRAAKVNGVYEFSRAYIKHLGHSEYWEVYSSLLSIVMLQNYLDLHGIPYMFTIADNCVLDNYTINNCDQSIASLYDQLDFDNWYIFPGNKGFYQWAMENKYPVGDTHPLEEAHYDAAQLMKYKFNELVTKCNKQN